MLSLSIEPTLSTLRFGFDFHLGLDRPCLRECLVASEYTFIDSVHKLSREEVFPDVPVIVVLQLNSEDDCLTLPPIRTLLSPTTRIWQSALSLLPMNRNSQAREATSSLPLWSTAFLTAAGVPKLSGIFTLDP